MNEKNGIWTLNLKKSEGYMILIVTLMFLLTVSFAASLPSSPLITYNSSTTFTSGTVNRSTDAKGTITTVTLSATQQDLKWKAYVGNVSGTLALRDASGTAIYSWTTGAVMGEVYVSRFPSITWASVSCANQTAINNEQTGISMASAVADNINSTFNYTTHAPFNVSTNLMSGCRSTATYVSGTSQTMNANATFQEILLMDNSTTNLVYTALINASSAGYNNQTYDFQMIVGENESASTPTTYYFWVELG